MARGAGQGVFGFLQGLFGGGQDLELGGAPSRETLDPEMEAVKRAYLDVRLDDPQREAKVKAILDRIAALKAARGG